MNNPGFDAPPLVQEMIAVHMFAPFGIVHGFGEAETLPVGAVPRTKVEDKSAELELVYEALRSKW